ncbi:hypothetical protein CHS0354_016803 [Potamilus streckersoni]|uniref:Peptidylglycine monooxygenase n=1 Tax=Potamilus streckersoni TaxID=2493646 RepID=A0AAE0T3U0_9BIVA|nr:hypothetical protein CHS0354_016803 [Potamilus streckersoni]
MEWQAVEIRLCQWILLMLVIIHYTCIQCNPINVTSEVTKRTLIQMPKIHVDKPDSYICMAVPVTDLEFSTIVGFKIDVVKEITHHVSIAFCEDYETRQTVWDCKSSHGHICSGRSTVFGGWDGWSKNHSDTVFPDDVGIQLGKDVKMNYVIIQTHFKEAVPDPDALKSNPTNVTLFLAEESRNYSFQKVSLYSSGYIPAFSEDFKAEITCKWESVPVQLYEYFAHTHNYGQLIEGYIVRNNTKILLAMDKPKGKSHDTVVIEGRHTEIRPGDILAVRCSFRNTGSSKVLFGLGGSDEMCNLELSFKYDAKEINAFPQSVKCGSDAQEKVWCPNGEHKQVGVLCDLQHESANKAALEDVHNLMM